MHTYVLYYTYWNIIKYILDIAENIAQLAISISSSFSW